MTENFFIARLFQMCEEDRINWADCDEGGFITQINGVDIRIIGGGESWIYLSVSSGPRRWTIREPIPHISDAPAGKLANWIRKIFGLSPMKGPKKDSDKINAEIRANLISIRNFALNQAIQKYKRNPGYNEERQELFQQVIYGELIKRR